MLREEKNKLVLILFVLLLSHAEGAFRLFYNPPEYKCPPSHLEQAGYNCSQLYEPLEIVGSRIMLVS